MAKVQMIPQQNTINTIQFVNFGDNCNGMYDQIDQENTSKPKKIKIKKKNKESVSTRNRMGSSK